MKTLQKISLLTFVLALFSFVQINAQTAPATTKTSVVKIKTSGECDMCKKKIEAEVGKMSGVKKAELDVDSKILTVEYNAKRTSPDKIRKALANIGYDADDVKANNRAQKELPACCRPKTDSIQK
jgi:mercuric ion binding protein